MKKYLSSKIIILSIATLSSLGYVDAAFGQYQSGQTQNGIMPNIMPVSAEAASLGKYGDWPVSYYTGTVGISIPIYQIKTKGLEIPIQLSYHTGGIKVDEVPSWCGTGWTLNAGGAITRTIVGLPDEFDTGYYGKNKRGEFIKSSYDLNNPVDYAELRKAADQGTDTEPDIFYFNFAGNSGKFYFDQQGNFQAIPVNSLKLINSPITNYLTDHWEIADDKGNVFFFASDGQGTESTMVKTVGMGGIDVQVQEPNAWYLTKIVLNNNADIIYFDYISKAERVVQPPVFSYKMLASGSGPISSYILNPQPKLGLNTIFRNGGNNDGVYSPTTVLTGGITMLSKIRWSEGEINFDASISRQDIAFGKNLSSIKVLDKSMEQIKDVRFSYAYVGQRYYLDSLVEFGANSVRKNAYSFEYHDRNMLSIRNSNAQDHWGYYNGATSNTHLLPPDPQFNDISLNANREPSESLMMAGALRKIIYPTGGATQLEYEANHYEAQGVPGGGNPQGPITAASKTVNASDPQSTTYQRIQTFDIPFTQNMITVNLQFGNYKKPPVKGAGPLPIIKIQRLVNQVYQDVYSWDAFDNFPVNPIQNQNGYYDFQTSKSVNLTTGDYRIIADILPVSFGLEEPPPILPFVTAVINYQTYGPATPATGEAIAGGLRIKEIINYSGESITSRKKYTYGGGKLLIYPKYVHEYGEDVWPKADCQTNEHGCMIQCETLFAKYKESISSGTTILGFTQGSPVGYTSVVEKDVDASNIENGYSNYFYSYVADDFNELQFDGSYWLNTTILNGSVPMVNNDYKRGLLLEKLVYKRNETGTFINVATTVNTYNFNDGNTANRFNRLRALRVKKMRVVNYPCGTFYGNYILPSGGFSPDLAYAFYDLHTGWVQSASTRETIFDKDGLNPVITQTNYSYGNPAHLQVTGITKTNSKELSNEQQLLYPHEMVALSRDPAGIYQSMIGKNMISPVIEKKDVVNGQISLQLTNYFQSHPGIFVPETVEERNSRTGINEVKLKYHHYLDNGSVSSVSLAAGPKVVYLYSYNKQYPVAEIKNADYAAVESILGAAAIQSLRTQLNPDKAAIDAIVNSLRMNLPNAQITSCSYKPLVGVTSQTDAKGQTTYYEYDGFGRLKWVKDQNGNVIKENTYHYKN